VLALGGFVVGLLPLIVDNLTAPPAQDSLSVFLHLNEVDAGRVTLAEQVHGAVLIGIPLGSGLCPATQCAPWQAAWGLLYPLLLVAAAVLALVGLRRPTPTVDRPDLAQAPVPLLRIRYAAQLALVVAAGLTLLGYARSAAAGLTPTESARYLTVLQISLPAALWPLWLAAAEFRRRGSAALRLSGAVAVGLLVALATTMMITTIQQITQVSAIRAEEHSSQALADAVRQRGIQYAYTDYWTCHRLVFTTREGVVCAVLTDNLRPGQNRHHEYLHAVTRAPRPAFIFETESAGDHAFRRYLDGHDIQAPMTEVGGYRIYQPEVQVRPW
jgi:hypothetical protein